MVSLPKKWSLSKSKSRHRGPRYSRGRLRTASDGDEQQAFLFADGDDVASDENSSRDAGDKNSASARKAPAPAFFEHRIVEGETLQGLALRYGCSVGALRHLNNLLSDQDFFALVVLKVPDRIHVATGQLIDPVEPADDTISVTSDGTESPPDKAIRYWRSLDDKVEAALQQRGSGDESIPIELLENGADGRHAAHTGG
ncbi:hypothetical protein HPB48_013864 [Haemaphysalis longicornis]|uniref:LysM domain-containing protein n=1 Tax=Haemaphysalis longicornis TaxID=44386 RepID=A0A9J6G436_HAELO|nr:hypothetical protein HPB48_013864 [Haemaphysalis longicornis]